MYTDNYIAIGGKDKQSEWDWLIKEYAKDAVYLLCYS
jgi:hypothetical protein